MYYKEVYKGNDYIHLNIWVVRERKTICWVPAKEVLLRNTEGKSITIKELGKQGKGQGCVRVALYVGIII